MNRFGCQISYSKPSQKEFFDIVIGLARKNNVKMTDEELMTGDFVKVKVTGTNDYDLIGELI